MPCSHVIPPTLKSVLVTENGRRGVISTNVLLCRAAVKDFFRSVQKDRRPRGEALSAVRKVAGSRGLSPHTLSSAIRFRDGPTLDVRFTAHEVVALPRFELGSTGFQPAALTY